MPRAIAEALAAEVARAGADTVFGLPGGGPNLDVVGAADAAGLRFVLAHGETAACIMAGTYGLLTERPALAVATRGPGAASAVNGAAQATLDRFPLLLVTDAVPAAQARRVAHQRLDQRALLAPATKYTGTLGRRDPAGTAAAALALAAAQPPGAVHLDLDHTVDGTPVPVPAPLAPPTPEAMARAAALATAATRPIAVVGTGALAWAAEVRAALATVGCPALTTYQAAGLVPVTSPQFGGLFTNGALERPLLADADLVLAVGLDPVEPIPAAWHLTAPVVSIAPWPVVDPYYVPDVELTGPVGPLLGRLVPALRSTWPAGSARVALDTARAAIRAAPAAFGPVDVVDEVAAAAPPGVVATVDAGAHFLAVMPLWPAREPLGLLISNGLATMGFAVPAAIGAALARPGHPVVCFVGDGGLGMTLAELETIARLDLPVTVVVFDDAALSLIEVKQRDGHGGAGAVRYRPVDFARAAAAFGLDAVAADDRAGLARALTGSWDRPRLIDARIDPSPYRDIIRATRG